MKTILDIEIFSRAATIWQQPLHTIVKLPIYPCNKKRWAPGKFECSQPQPVTHISERSPPSPSPAADLAALAPFPIPISQLQQTLQTSSPTTQNPTLPNLSLNQSSLCSEAATIHLPSTSHSLPQPSLCPAPPLSSNLPLPSTPSDGLRSSDILILMLLNIYIAPSHNLIRW
ncbi:hypothetical protein F2P56_035454 [Juglans regia]|uniref:Uncharacterized protein n=1 Tax=Juglans regia TaxID=51240 RepID=A0A833WSC6_JUGRE|nr:hypothetical protein F2P56_035454 [Juglans regia]